MTPPSAAAPGRLHPAQPSSAQLARWPVTVLAPLASAWFWVQAGPTVSSSSRLPTLPTPARLGHPSLLTAQEPHLAQETPPWSLGVSQQWVQGAMWGARPHCGVCSWAAQPVPYLALPGHSQHGVRCPSGVGQTHPSVTKLLCGTWRTSLWRWHLQVAGRARGGRASLRFPAHHGSCCSLT